MELFELLFIALFILFPVLEQVLKRRRQSGPDEPGPDPMETEEGEVSPRPSNREPVQASDMVPDDLWAVLTGESRHREGVGEGVGSAGQPTAGEGTAPGRGAATPAEPSPPPPADEGADWEDAWTPRPEPRWRLEETDVPEPVSLERYGPEAYSLERLDYEPFERSLPTPEARHRRFHESIQRAPRRRRPRRTGLGRSLGSPASLRQAMILTEVLGPPKGLE